MKERINPVKCPKCGNKERLNFLELWKNNTIQWEYLNGEFVGGYKEQGYPYMVTAECKNDSCLHHWRLRGIQQITQIPNYEQDVF